MSSKFWNAYKGKASYDSFDSDDEDVEDMRDVERQAEEEDQPEDRGNRNSDKDYNVRYLNMLM